MNSIFEPGIKCLLDGKTEVIVLKPFNKTHAKYVIEIPNRSVEIVDTSRLASIGTKSNLPN